MYNSDPDTKFYFCYAMYAFPADILTSDKSLSTLVNGINSIQKVCNAFLTP